LPAKIPIRIKKEVIRKWLNGVQREEIAVECGVSAGMIIDIISSAKMHADISQEDFNLTRETVLMLKREGLANDELVPLMRLHGFLKERNLRETQIEQLIDEFDTHFFKRKGVSPEEYVDTIINLSLISRKFNVPLEKVLDSVNEKRRERDTLAEDIEELKNNKMVAIQDYSTTLEKLEEYEENRPLREAYKIL
jgi:hypothetical protein